MEAFVSDGEGAPAAPTTASRPLRATCFCRTSRRCFSGSFPTKKPRAYARSFFVKLILAATYSPTNTLRSTIGEGGLNCRVRHGTGCVPSSVTTRNLYVLGCDLCCFCCPDLRLCIAVFFDALFYHISCDIGLDLDAERMKHEGGGSEGVYVIRRGCADECFAVMRQI